MLKLVGNYPIYSNLVGYLIGFMCPSWPCISFTLFQRFVFEPHPSLMIMAYCEQSSYAVSIFLGKKTYSSTISALKIGLAPNKEFLNESKGDIITVFQKNAKLICWIASKGFSTNTTAPESLSVSFMILARSVCESLRRVEREKCMKTCHEIRPEAVLHFSYNSLINMILRNIYFVLVGIRE